MAQYRKKPVVVEAVQWWRLSDHPAVEAFIREPHNRVCKSCGGPLTGTHGWVETLEGGHIVCPGDYIITGVSGEHYPCKPAIFEATYEPVD